MLAILLAVIARAAVAFQVKGRYSSRMQSMEEIKTNIQSLSQRADLLCTLRPTAAALGSPLHLTEPDIRLAAKTSTTDTSEIHHNVRDNHLATVSPADEQLIEDAALESIKKKLRDLYP